MGWDVIVIRYAIQIIFDAWWRSRATIGFMSERKDVVYRDLMDMGPWDAYLGHGLEMKTYDAPENDKQIPHSSVHEALQVTRARNKKENGIGRNRELAQGDAQWSRSTLVSSPSRPSRRQAKCSQTEMPSMIPTACHPMTVCLLYDLVLVLVDSITAIIMANHPMVRATQDASKVCP